MDTVRDIDSLVAKAHRKYQGCLEAYVSRLKNPEDPRIVEREYIRSIQSHCDHFSREDRSRMEYEDSKAAYLKLREIQNDVYVVYGLVPPED